MTHGEDIRSYLCIAAGFNLLVRVPIGALIGHFARGGRLREAAWASCWGQSAGC